MVATTLAALVEEARRVLPAPAALGFGRHLAPIVVQRELAEGGVWGPAALAPLGEAKVAVASGAVQYGLTVFEGLKALRAPDGSLHLFRADRHARRFRDSAARIALPLVEEAVFLDDCARLVAAIEPLAPPPGEGSLYLRPTIFASEEALGVRRAARHVFSVTASVCAAPTPRPLRLWIERHFVRASPGGVGAAKTGANYAAGLLAGERAKERGCDSVLWLDAIDHTRLTEAGTMNVFVALEDRLLTPPLDGTILAGVTRDTCIALARDMGLVVEEAAPTVDDLAAWSQSGRLREVFCTGTASGVVSVETVVGEGLSIPLPEQALATRLRAAFETVQGGRAADTRGYLRPVAAPSVRASTSRAPESHEEAAAFARTWAEAWNRRDLDAVLAHFADDVVFESPKAVGVVGHARVAGKAELRRYWEGALARSGALHFTIDDVTLDAPRGRLVIHYCSSISGAAPVRAVESMRFGEHGRIVAATACYGAPTA